MIHQARNERAFPGDGTLDLAGMLGVLPAGVPLSLEAPVNSLAATLSPVERAQRGKASDGRAGCGRCRASQRPAVYLAAIR